MKVGLGPMLVGLVGLLALAGAARGQALPDLYDFARPELTWYTLETEHFNVVFHHDSSGEGSSRTAQVVARIAEDVYEPITSLYQHRPDTKVSIVLKDFEDYSNGAAYFFDNKIEIWAPALDSPLRGDHNWLRNVITHEFTHIVQLQAAMKAGRRMPFLYFQYLGYEDVKRPDVLYGYPNVIATYPVPVVNGPAWLAEGTAQYQRSFLDYDRWDSHRDMLLRTRVLAGEELSLSEMGGFYSHSSLLREGVYNQGYAFSHYLANTYGEEVLRDVTHELSRWSSWNVERALKRATGKPGAEIYREWMDTLRREYDTRTAPIRSRLVDGRLVEEEGFSNFYPRFSPDGRRLAYISNRGEDFNLTSLYVRDLESGTSVSHRMPGLSDGGSSYTCSLGHEHRVRSGIGGAVDWHPDGNRVVFARAKDTRKGYRYSDLYTFELESKEETRLTTNARAFAPVYSPDASRIAYVGQTDGSANLFVLEAETGEKVRLTEYHDGSQVSDPVWHPEGRWIYFALSRDRGRDLMRIPVEPGGTQTADRDRSEVHLATVGSAKPKPASPTPEAVLAKASDERSPAFDADGRLYYSSDESGIFNLYRVALSDGMPSGPAERVTNVLGGAFMPDVASGGRVAFARYDWNGYKIAVLDEADPLQASEFAGVYEPPAINRKRNASHAAAWSYDDSDLIGISSDVDPSDRRVPLRLAKADEPTEGPAAEPYSSLFTSFSFYPVVRIDQYAARREDRLDRRLPRRTYSENVLRNTKAGVYVSSREMLEEMSFLGGLMIGPASRDAESFSNLISPTNLLKLERDAFMLFDYSKGFGVLPDRWSPQISIELFNIRRNVENGLSIEEFPCTACYPDTTFVDLAYTLWQADLFARSKVTKDLLLEAGFRYSPYRVTTERFFSEEADQFIDESATRYFIGRAMTLGAHYSSERPHRHSNVVRNGIRVDTQIEREDGRLLQRFDVEDGLLVPSYTSDTNYRVMLDARLGVRLAGEPLGGAHGVGLRLRGSSILGKTVDGFYNDYVGGLIGARGYPFYALGGNETLWFQAAYQFPILPNISRQILFLYADKLYGRVYADAAMAWSGAWPGLGDVRKDLGAELRLGLGSFYLLPTAVFLSATYGVDAFDFRLDEGFLTPDGRNSVRYGKELLWHFGILFNFDV